MNKSFNNECFYFLPKIFCDNFSIAMSMFNISVKMFAFNSMINQVYTFNHNMDSSIFEPRDKTEQK